MRVEASLARLALVLGISMSVGFGCAKPPPDPDGLASQARSLGMDYWQADQLHCKKGDCVDWYRIALLERGELRVDVRTPQAAGYAQSLYVRLTASNGQTNIADAVGGGTTLRATADLQPGTYLVSVGSLDPGRAAPLPYDVHAHLEVWRPPPPPPPPPAPPQPRFETLDSEVLEIERHRNEPDAVLLSFGAQFGVEAGQRGRLKNANTTIAEFEIVDVYPDGSRAQLLDYPTEKIMPTTVAEIDVPAGSRAAVPSPPTPPQSEERPTSEPPDSEPEPAGSERPWLNQ